MSLYNTFELKGIKTTSNETILEVDVGNTHKFFILNQMKNDNVFDKTKQQNKDSLLMSDSQIIHNMYDLDKLWYHSQAARRHRYPYEQEQYDYQHIYKRPNEDQNNVLACMTRLGDTLYALDTLGEDGHSYVNDEMYKWLINDNGWNVPRCQKIATMLYGNGVLSDVLGRDSSLSDFYTQQQLSVEGIFPTSAMLGVKYNTVYEIPGSIKQDYSKGELVANSFKTKNQYNAEWTMANDLSNGMYLKDARNYSEIHSCGGTLWLKYKTTENYVSANSDIIVYPSYCKQINLEQTTPSEMQTLPQVEVITRINRGVEAPQHKTTLYSLQLNTTLLDDIVPAEALIQTTVDVDENGDIAQPGAEVAGTKNAVVGMYKDRIEKLKQNLKAEIKNCIRKIAENIAPANAQLFSVTVNS